MDQADSSKQEHNDFEQTSKLIKKEEYPAKVEENEQFYFPPCTSLEPLTVPWGACLQGYPPFPTNFPQYMNNPLQIWKPPIKKPFIIIREVKKSEPDKPVSDQVQEQVKIKVKTILKPRKKKKRTYNCKNYVGLICAGFSRTILTALPNSEILDFITKSIERLKPKFDTLCDYSGEMLIDTLKEYVYKDMCGKKVRKANKERDFKIRNITDLQSLLNIVLPKDNELICFTKEVLKETMEFFFDSDYYNQWLSNGMMTGPNRLFFLKNKTEIQKKILNPGLYKPRFSI